jgi:sugar O-acyltransferase (sialic acid O-acetyltransferase NeuD family)
MNKVVIFGTGEFAQVACAYLQKDSPYQVAAFTVDQQFLREPELLGRDVVPFETLARTHPPTEYAMFVAMGFRQVNRARAEVYARCKARGYQLISYVNSRAVHWDDFPLGDNCFIFENNVIQPFVKIGNNVVLWSGNHIGHHVEIGDHCFITSHVVLSGGATVGDYCFIGVNATVRDHVRIAPSCVIGAGTLILQDTQPEAVYRAEGSEPSRVPSSRLRNF